MVHQFLRRTSIVLAALAYTFSVVPALSSPIGDLQQLLIDSGYSDAGTGGQWTEQTAEALSAFASAHDLTIAVPATTPSDSDIEAVAAAVKGWLDADEKSYPSKPMPAGYFFGMGNEWYRNIHNWGSSAVASIDGKLTRIKTKRWSELLPQDMDALRAAGVTVMRMPLHWEGMVFWDQCRGAEDPPYDEVDQCYAKSYDAAKKGKWADETVALDHFADNPAIQMYMDAVKTLIDKGFHVLLAPNDFYFGSGNFHVATTDPLLHVYLESDPGLRAFYAKWIGALVEELRRRNLTDVSLQSLNEPRFCPNGKPGSKALAAWTALDTQIIDSARRVAPHLHIITSAACTASDQFMSQGRSTYADALPKLVPVHAYTNIDYALHIRSPRLLFQAGDLFKLKPDAEIPYPFKKITSSVLAAGGDKFQLEVYNKSKPSPEYFDRVFSDIAAFGKAHGISMIVSEWDVNRPEYNVTREARVALIRDFSAAAKAHGVPTIYNAIFETGGLTSCPTDKYTADHRFDPDILRMMAHANGVSGATDDPTLTPLEATCGPVIEINAREGVGEPSRDDGYFNSVLRMSTKAVAEFDVAVSGRFTSSTGSYDPIDFTFIRSLTKKEAGALKKQCNASIQTFDEGTDHLLVRFTQKGSTFSAYNMACLLKAAPKDLAPQIKLAVGRFPDVARDMTAGDTLETVTNDTVRTWIGSVADGTFAVVASDDAGPKRATDTREEMAEMAGDSAEVNSFFRTSIADAAEGEDALAFNIQGKYAVVLKNYYEFRIVIAEPALPSPPPDGLRSCAGNPHSQHWSGDDADHIVLTFLAGGAGLKPMGLECLVSASPGNVGFQLDYIAKHLKTIAADMVDSGSIDGVRNSHLKAWLKDLASGAVVVEGAQ